MSTHTHTHTHTHTEEVKIRGQGSQVTEFPLSKTAII